MREYQIVLPISTGFMIPADDSVRLLNDLLEGLDYSRLHNTFSRLGRKPSTSPKTMFKIITYSYMNQIYSSRKIEKACRRDINFIWLLGGEKAPDHNTVNRFRNERLNHVMEDLFYQLVRELGNRNEIAYENIFVDGTKIEANANKYTFVWKKSTQKHEARLQENIKVLIGEINLIYNTAFPTENEKYEVSLLNEIFDLLNTKKAESGIEFVYGKGKRKTPLQRHVDKLVEYREKQMKYDGYNETFDGRNSFSKTDKDATFMHMKEDHMRNSQLKPGYNVQIGVEGEYIVGMDISSERSDQLTLKPFLENLDIHLPKRHKNIVADAGYESEENYDFLELREQESYIKPSTHEIMKKRSFKNKIARRENMTYDPIKDEYRCHNQRVLTYICDRKRTSKSGYVSTLKVYECESCEECEYKPLCTRAKNNRQLHVSENFIRKREQSSENIKSVKGIILRMNRSIQVEGAFGVLKEDYRFRRFLTRGKHNVKTEFLLLCFGYNVNKLHRKMMNKKCGVTLFKSGAA